MTHPLNAQFPHYPSILILMLLSSLIQFALSQCCKTFLKISVHVLYLRVSQWLVKSLTYPIHHYTTEILWEFNPIRQCNLFHCYLSTLIFNSVNDYKVVINVLVLNYWRFIFICLNHACLICLMRIHPFLVLQKLTEFHLLMKGQALVKSMMDILRSRFYCK